ncbi:MAG: hypothetical protein WCG26_00510 [Chloroflexales bacterium]
MSHTIIDTNVPIVANGHADQASLPCIVACQHLLAEFAADGRMLVLDTAWHILREYMHKLRPEGQPGLGDAFLKWVLTNHANPRRCERVMITASPNAQSAHDFAEFPADPALAGFDPSDRKFVAVACAHPARPPIYNAVDTDWRHYQEALAANGVVVAQVCPDDVRRLVDRKSQKAL